MKYYILATLMAIPITSAQADIFTYTCRVDGKSHKVKIDDLRKILIWQGKSYNIKIQEDCAKFGWRATSQGASFDFCTATQGYAEFQFGDKLIQCDQNR